MVVLWYLLGALSWPFLGLTWNQNWLKYGYLDGVEQPQLRTPQWEGLNSEPISNASNYKKPLQSRSNRSKKP